MKCNNYTTTPLSKFCYKCDPRLQNIKYIKKSDEKCHTITTTKTHQNSLKIIDHIQDKLKPKLSSVKNILNKNISKYKQNIKDDTVKIKKSLENFENSSLTIINNKNQNIKEQEKYWNNKKIAITKFPFAKLKNPKRFNLCFLNSAIQFILSIQPIADLLIQQHVKNNLIEMSLSQDYLTVYYNEIEFLHEFESLAFSMLQNPTKTFLADTLAYSFQQLGICRYNVGQQWDSSEIINLFFTFYEKFVNALQLFTLKSNVSNTLASIKTKVQHIRKCNRCGEESVTRRITLFLFCNIGKKG